MYTKIALALCIKAVLPLRDVMIPCSSESLEQLSCVLRTLAAVSRSPRLWSAVVLLPTLRLKNDPYCYSARSCICVATFSPSQLEGVKYPFCNPLANAHALENVGQSTTRRLFSHHDGDVVQKPRIGR